jgi:hypothetical protein
MLGVHLSIRVGSLISCFFGTALSSKRRDTLLFSCVAFQMTSYGLGYSRRAAQICCAGRAEPDAIQLLFFVVSIGHSVRVIRALGTIR